VRRREELCQGDRNAICALQVEICVIAAVLRVLVNAIEEAATVAS